MTSFPKKSYLYLSFDFKSLAINEMVVHRILRRGDVCVSLVGLLHVANTEFYDSIVEKFDKPGVIALTEGVHDSKGFMRGHECLGLDVSADLEELDFQPDALFTKEINVDVDWKEFSPGARKAIKLLSLAESHNSLVEYVKFMFGMGHLFKSFWSRLTEPKIWHEAVYCIEDMRNEALIKGILTYAENNKDIVVPWGCAHMPAVEEALIKNGFTVESEGAFLASNLIQNRINEYKNLAINLFEDVMYTIFPPRKPFKKNPWYLRTLKFTKNIVGKKPVAKKNTVEIKIRKTS